MIAKKYPHWLGLAAVAWIAFAAMSASGPSFAAEDPVAEPTAVDDTESHPAQQDAANVDEAGHDPAAGHGDHDVFDLGHADAGPMLENPIELRFDMTLASFAIFVVLLGLLTKFAWRPIMEGLDRREEAIAGQIADAKRTADQAAEQLQQYRDKLAAASGEAHEIIVQARRNAEEIAEQIREEARKDAQRERAQANADIDSAKRAAMREMAQQSADLAIGLAGRILSRELRPADHATLIGEALDSFPSQN